MESREILKKETRSVTLNMLRDAQHSLNMRLLLALQNHDANGQRRLEAELRDVQVQIDRMKSGVRSL